MERKILFIRVLFLNELIVMME